MLMSKQALAESCHTAEMTKAISFNALVYIELAKQAKDEEEA